MYFSSEVTGGVKIGGSVEIEGAYSPGNSQSFSGPSVAVEAGAGFGLAGSVAVSVNPEPGQPYSPTVKVGVGLGFGASAGVSAGMTGTADFSSDHSYRPRKVPPPAPPVELSEAT